MPVLENAHGLVVGISNYKNVTKLSPTVLRDSMEVYKTLIDPKACAYPPKNVTLLQDEKATGQALREALKKLAETTDGSSTVTIYLSSHGGRIDEGEYRGEYIAPVDAQYDPADPSKLAATGISGDEFTASLEAIPAAKVLVLLDCCHAGGIGEAKDLAPESGLVKGFSQEMYDRLGRGEGRAILASARPEEKSYILPGDDHSLFTKHLLAGLRGGVAGEDEFVRVFRLFEYVQPRVTGQHSSQHPRFKANLGDNFPVAFYKGGEEKQLAPQPAVAEEEFTYDLYISYTDKEPDASWVWDTFIPKLKADGFDPKRIAVAGEVREPGVTLLLEAERALKSSKRVVMAMSNQYFDDPRATFDFELAQDLQVRQENFRLLPVIFAPGIDENRIPDRIRMYTTSDLSKRTESRTQTLIDALKRPLPTR